MSAGIRKQRKARWLYECRACEFTSSITSDLFGAQENQLHHERTLGHAFKIIEEAFKPLVDFVSKFANADGQTQKDFALIPPANIPHDPALLRDRRKWGGR